MKSSICGIQHTCFIFFLIFLIITKIECWPVFKQEPIGMCLSTSAGTHPFLSNKRDFVHFAMNSGFGCSMLHFELSIIIVCWNREFCLISLAQRLFFDVSLRAHKKHNSIKHYPTLLFFIDVRIYNYLSHLFVCAWTKFFLFIYTHLGIPLH